MQAKLLSFYPALVLLYHRAPSASVAFVPSIAIGSSSVRCNDSREPTAAILCPLRYQRETSLIDHSPVAVTSDDSVSAVDITSPTTSSRLQLNIHVEESRVHHEINGSTILLAARTIGKVESVNTNNEYNEGECQGYLVQTSDYTYGVHMSCGHDGIDHFASVFHKLLLEFLAIEYELYEEERDRDGTCISKLESLRMIVSLDDVDAKLLRRLEQLGFTPHSTDKLGFGLAQYTPFLNQFTFQHRGTEQGNASLQMIKMLCKRRVSYEFDPPNEDESGTIQNNSSHDVKRSIVSHQKNVLPPSTIERVMEIIDEIKARKWLSTNPDSVDGLPSLHLNLISNGQPLFENETQQCSDGGVTFSQCVTELTNILRPHLYENLLATVKKLTNSTTVEIDDVFVRSYGVLNDEEKETATRYGLSSHYDVTAYITGVMPLDDVSSSGRNGLYTIPQSDERSSGNAALRKFFPLDKGDGVLHTFDVLHGVDVDPKLNKPRTSLIVWFVDKGVADEKETSTIPQSWLRKPEGDCSEFVAAIASEYTDGDKDVGASLKLYLSSASKGNPFAMTALAQMCDDGEVPESEYDKVRGIVSNYNLFNPFSPTKGVGVTAPSCIELAPPLWYRAAIEGGHRVSANSLAVHIMQQYTLNEDEMDEDEQLDALLMASTLFSLVQIQGYDASDSLERLMDVEYTRLRRIGVTEEKFFASPVVQQILSMTV